MTQQALGRQLVQSNLPLVHRGGHARHPLTQACVVVDINHLGLLLELWVRVTLVDRAGFRSLTETRRLLITAEHPLITDGVFGHIRHPLYLGRITLDFGIALLFSSLWGAVLMAISALLFLIRIRVEEEMLIDEFGDAYLEYRKHTKKLIPRIY